MKYTHVVAMLCHIGQFGAVYGTCAMFNYCNGHGRCELSTNKCECYEGWGASSDITLYRSPDCSMRSCPAGKAWADVPTADKIGHRLAECSNRGVCDRYSGECKCFPGFTGDACNRNKCPNDCSGHGQCLSMKQLAKINDALPLSENSYYEGEEETATWDEDMSFACVCDSSWPVGLRSGETQVPEWFGADCSKRHCPSADDINTAFTETVCFNVTAPNSEFRGKPGNLCFVECSNRGLCDYRTGTCHCFDGHYGADCTLRDVNARFTKI